MNLTPIGLCALGLLSRALAAAPVEYRYLDSVADPKQWGPAECEVMASTHRVWEHPALRMRIPVDFSSGEKAYPIGWPRMYLNLKADGSAWREYDRLEFQLFCESATRTNLPKRPLMFHLYGSTGEKRLYPLDIAELGQWRTFTVNLPDLGFTGEVARLGFNINESDYADKDLVDFHLGGFRLARATAAQITELKAAPALMAGSRVLPVEVVAEGPLDKLAAGLPFQLRCGDRIALSRTMPLARGRQTLYLPLGGTALDPGVYTLAASPDDPVSRREAAVTVTSSPWR